MPIACFDRQVVKRRASPLHVSWKPGAWSGLRVRHAVPLRIKRGVSSSSCRESEHWPDSLSEMQTESRAVRGTKLSWR